MFRIGGNSTDQSCFSASRSWRNALPSDRHHRERGAGHPADLRGHWVAGAPRRQPGHQRRGRSALPHPRCRGASAGRWKPSRAWRLETSRTFFRLHVIATFNDGGRITERPNDGGWSLTDLIQEFNSYVDVFRGDGQAAALPVAGPAICCAASWKANIPGTFIQSVRGTGSNAAVAGHGSRVPHEQVQHLSRRRQRADARGAPVPAVGDFHGRACSLNTSPKPWMRGFRIRLAETELRRLRWGARRL